MTRHQRVVVVGLDAVSWDILQLFMDRGTMPVLKGMIPRMMTGTLLSTDPPVTVPAWRSMMSGVNPGKLGVYGFFVQQGETAQQAFRLHPPVATVQDLLRLQGYRSITINLPLSDPKDPRDPWLASFVSPYSATYWPEDLGEQIPEVREYLNHHVQEGLEEKDFFAEVVAIEKARIRASQALFQFGDWHLFFTMISGTDWMHHRVLNRFWQGQFEPEVLDLYQRIDSFLGWIVQQMEPSDLLLLVSDHGSATASQTFFLNKWLEDQGYLRWRLGEVPELAQRPDNRGESEVHTVRVPPWLNSALRRSGLNRALRPLARRIGVRPSAKYYVDVANSQAYMGRYSSWPEIYVNDPAIMPKLVADLKAIVDPVRQQAVFPRVETRETAYGGSKALAGAPDIVLSPRHDIGVLKDFAPRWFETGNLNTHKREGIIGLFNSSCVASELGAVPIWRVAPTILRWLGVSAPEWMDGTGLEVGPAPMQPHQMVRRHITELVRKKVR